MASKKETAKRIRLSLSTPTDADIAWASKLVAEYRANGIGSNRANWERVAVLLACYAVAERGEYCALPAITGDSPVYNRAWRAMRSALSQEQWLAVRVCAVENGRFSTTAKTGTAYIVPAKMVTQGEAPEGW